MYSSQRLFHRASTLLCLRLHIPDRAAYAGVGTAHGLAELVTLNNKFRGDTEQGKKGWGEPLLVTGRTRSVFSSLLKRILVIKNTLFL